MPQHLCKLKFLILLLLTACYSNAQDSTHRHLPIIDVHVHAMKMNPAFSMDMCPWFFRRLVQAGFEKRIMYGTDLLVWAKLLETSIGVIENANYLSFDQKRDILFNNAVRFFRLDESKFR